MSKNLRRLSVLAALATLVVALLVVGQGFAQTGPNATLGEELYFDANLSDCSLVGPGEVCNPDGQSCASCHDPGFGFVDPDKGLPVSEGVIFGRFGGRNSPSSAYAMYSPMFGWEIEEGAPLYSGGQFWDGRATGDVLGDPLADQALGPFLNPVEMANPSKATVVQDALNNVDYGEDFEAACGTEVDSAYDCIALSIAAFERTPLFAPFSSKYDHYLQACLAAGGDKDDCALGTGLVAEDVGPSFFTKKEWYGMQLFMNDTPGEGAMCVLCHVADWTADPGNVVVPDWSPDGTIPPLFTDFTYDNLGVPKSDHRLLANNAVDPGLGGFLSTEEGEEYLCDASPDCDEWDYTFEEGKFKVMTLRNVHLTGPYAHNGFFKQLEDITHFYNTRDVLAEGWPDAEYPNTVNTDELGDLGLSAKDEDALVKFMKTLTDGWVP